MSSVIDSSETRDGPAKIDMDVCVVAVVKKVEPFVTSDNRDWKGIDTALFQDKISLQPWQHRVDCCVRSPRV